MEYTVLVDKIYIACITEIKLFPRQQLKFLNYTIFGTDLNKLHQEEMAIYVCPQLTSTLYSLPEHFSNLQATCISVLSPGGPLSVVSCYCLTNTPLSKDLLAFISKLSKAVILGDFKAHYSFGDTFTNPNDQILADFILFSALSC